MKVSPLVARFAFWAALLSTFSGIRAETVTIFGDDVYAPVTYSDRGQPAGLFPAILKATEAITGDHYEVRLMPWRRALELAQDGQGGVLGISHTSSRAKIFDYSRIVYDDDIQIVTLRDRPISFTSLSDLRGLVIGGVQGASYGDAIDAAIAQKIFTMDRDVGQIGRLRKLLAGRLDAAFVGNGSAGLEYILSSDRLLIENRDRFVVLSPPLVKDPLHLAFAKSMNKGALLRRFDLALGRLKESGELKDLIRRGGNMGR